MADKTLYSYADSLGEVRKDAEQRHDLWKKADEEAKKAHDYVSVPTTTGHQQPKKFLTANGNEFQGASRQIHPSSTQNPYVADHRNGQFDRVVAQRAQRLQRQQRK